MARYIVTLTEEEREILLSITKKGSHKSSKVRNALVLLNCDTGEYSQGKQANKSSNMRCSENRDANNRPNKEIFCRRWI